MVTHMHSKGGHIVQYVSNLLPLSLFSVTRVIIFSMYVAKNRLYTPVAGYLVCVCAVVVDPHGNHVEEWFGLPPDCVEARHLVPEMCVCVCCTKTI